MDFVTKVRQQLEPVLQCMQMPDHPGQRWLRLLCGTRQTHDDAR